MAGWKRVGEYLVRHPGGMIYLRARIDGKIVRISLDTSDPRTAKLRRDTKLKKLRSASSHKELSAARTIDDFLKIMEKDLEEPHLKKSTIKYYRAIFGILRAGLPVNTLGKDWGKSEAKAWWRDTAARYAPQRANNALARVKQLGDLLSKNGAQLDNPAAGLKRVRIPSKEVKLPSRDVLTQIIQSIQDQNKRWSKQAALYVGFLAYSGCRHAEAAACTWHDVGAEWLTIHGGEQGTKNWESRRVPISQPLKEILDQLRPQNPTEQTSRIFTIKTPRYALKGACERLGLPHLRLHDLRHWFSTWAIENGVDIPTVSNWLGHKDKGVLLMRTYGHLRDDHSLESAKKLI